MGAEVKDRQFLVDTDAIIALLKLDDPHHKIASRLSAESKKKNVQFFLSQYTVAEVATVLSYKVSQTIAIQFLAGIHHFDLTVIGATEAHFLKAEEVFVGQKKKGTSFFDCLNIALVQLSGFDGIFSFDKVYQKNGVKLYS